MINKPYNILVDSLLPDFIKEDYPTYVKFIKLYFETLEHDTGPAAVVNSLTDYIDVYSVSDDKLSSIIKEYMASFPIGDFENINVKTFISNSKAFYSKKGSVKSLQFIFDLIGGSLELYYPSDDIFHLDNSNLSGTKALHDNYYYAYYVYEIRSDQDIDKYKQLVESLVHPIGTKAFYKKIDFDNWIKFNYTESTQYIPLF